MSEQREQQQEQMNLRVEEALKLLDDILREVKNIMIELRDIKSRLPK